jgi:hypothetical protein
MYYCQVIPAKKKVEVESVVITIDDEEFVFDKDEAIELRDLLLDVFPKEPPVSWTYTTSPDTTTWSYPNTTMTYKTTGEKCV